MNDSRLWDLILQNAEHIKIINHELGDVVAEMAGINAHVEILEKMMWWGLGMMASIFVALIINIMITRKNGKR